MKTDIKPENREGQPRMAPMTRMKTRVRINHRDTEGTEIGIPSPLRALCASVVKPLRIRGFRSHFFASIFLPSDSVHRRNHGQEMRQKDGGKNISASLPLCALCVLLWQSALAGVHYV